MQIEDGKGTSQKAWVNKENRLMTDARTLELEHHEIHEGKMFTCHYSSTTTNIGEMTLIAFNTAVNGKWAHMVATASSSGAASFLIVRSPSIDNGEATATITIFNRNENSNKTSAVGTIEATPVIGSASAFAAAEAANANITTTIQLHHEDIGMTGNPVAVAGGSSRGQSEFVLRTNTQYAFILVADTDDTITHNIILNWYEDELHGPDGEFFEK